MYRNGYKNEKMESCFQTDYELTGFRESFSCRENFV